MTSCKRLRLWLCLVLAGTMACHGEAPMASDITVGVEPTDILHADVTDVLAGDVFAGSNGCGLDRAHPPGGIQLTQTFSAAAGGERSFYLSVPETYDSSQPQRLIVAYAGTNWLGEQIAPYFGFEEPTPEPGEIYVYPDVQWHNFPGWGEYGGWLLGPHAAPADGMADIHFTRELLERLDEAYCIDPKKVFATGHSWGGDMAAVVGCFLGDIFRAVAPAAANRPYWFEPQEGDVGCVAGVAVWTFFGQNDTHFSSQEYPGKHGDEQVAFWKALHGCDSTHTTLEVGKGECVQFGGCSQDTRYCLYDPDAGHQVPSYFSSAVLDWFRSF
jgi:polyhydroxybutyrate depolymerase